MKLLIHCGMLFILLFQQILPPATVFAKQTSTSQPGAESPGMVAAAPGFVEQADDTSGQRANRHGNNPLLPYGTVTKAEGQHHLPADGRRLCR